jgi:hypothetical protein
MSLPPGAGAEAGRIRLGAWPAQRAARLWLAAGLGAAAFAGLYAYATVFANTYTDDAYIQLRYAETLARHGTWGFYAGRTANTATSPLNVILTAMVTPLAGSAEQAVAWLAAAELTLLLIGLLLISKALFSGYFFGALAFTGFAANPLLLSTLGLEPLLYCLLFVAALYLYLTGRWTALAIALALLTLARADGLLLFLLVLAALPAGPAARRRVALIYGLALLPWHLFSWIHLGSVVPDTLVIKLRQGDWGPGISFPAGLSFYYLQRLPLPALLSFALLPFGLLAMGNASPRARHVVLIAGGYALAHFAAYSVMRVPPYHWYYTHLALAGILLGALGLASWLERASPAQRPGRAVAGGLALAVPVASLGLLALRSGLPLREAPIHTNWARPEQYRAVGLWLRQHTDPAEPIEMGGEIGTLAYYSDRQLVNNFSDSAAIPQYAAAAWYSRVPGLNLVTRLNFLWHTTEPFPPAAYRLEHVLGAGQPPEAAAVRMSWPTSSQWVAHGTVYLFRVR